MSVRRELAPNRNSCGESQSSPISSFMSMRYSVACFAVLIPPAGLNPTLKLVRS